MARRRLSLVCFRQWVDVNNLGVFINVAPVHCQECPSVVTVESGKVWRLESGKF